MRMPLKVFMFGYDGWGHSTKQLIQAVDAVEKARQYEPPLFVDIRIHRVVRAAGFREDAFEREVGPDRYEWMATLGNLAQRKDLKRYLQETYICHPDSAKTLLDRAYECARQRQRVIFFCSCETPNDCHRFEVAKLLKREAKRRGRSLEVVEWPGGVPTDLPDPVPVTNTKMPDATSPNLHLKRVRPFPLAKYAGLAYGSRVRVKIGDAEVAFAVGPARYDNHGWYLPVLRRESWVPIAATDTAASKYRDTWGYDPV